MINSIQLQPCVARIDSTAGKGCEAGRILPRFFVLAWAALLIALVAGCASTGELANPPRVSLADLRLAEVGLVEQRYAARLRIQNPNDARLNVRGMEYTIYVNGRKFADGVSGRDFSVPGYGEIIIEVNLTSTVLRVFEQFKNLSESESKIFRYRIAGSLSLAGLQRSIPFSHEDVIDLSADAGG